jgi:hypothetical protein
MQGKAAARYDAVLAGVGGRQTSQSKMALAAGKGKAREGCARTKVSISTIAVEAPW